MRRKQDETYLRCRQLKEASEKNKFQKIKLFYKKLLTNSKQCDKIYTTEGQKVPNKGGRNETHY